MERSDSRFMLFLLSFLFYVCSRMCLLDDLRRSVDLYIENRIYLSSHPPLVLVGRVYSSVAGISSGIKSFSLLIL